MRRYPAHRDRDTRRHMWILPDHGFIVRPPVMRTVMRSRTLQRFLRRKLRSEERHHGQEERP